MKKKENAKNPRLEYPKILVAVDLPCKPGQSKEVEDVADGQMR